MTRHYPDLGNASEWLCCVGNLIQSIRSTTQIWVVTRHQYGISAHVSQMSFRGETRGGIAKCRLFSQAKAFQVDYFLRIREKNLKSNGVLVVARMLKSKSLYSSDMPYSL